ncbi:hypothetical protein EIN_370070 [Entamoeba invadens IP1]|uniref:Uncharacterized protein n=1 Tax=Entamoeba invadens IP1 TaxID=370355 RepID=A0A0A1UBS5_ENTIV|nr:hypothetical protein EIN_370070 [Entamoeba invadens IP1]ELP92665.1 hypothetical protein EIN_370070 [Entamoeba invadens IP1]|eukprot:XP_004259436.1 hypothetical protein EIN_370070 [Entamoeba invadens IP1]
MSTEKKSVGIVLLGMPKVGKTCVVDAFNGKALPTEYEPTTTETETSIQLKFNEKQYHFTFYDSCGESMLDTRTTTNQILTKGKIHFYVASRTEADSGDFLHGFFKEIGDVDHNTTPFYRYIIITHSDKEDTDNIKQSIESFVPKDCPIKEYNLLDEAQKNAMITDFNDYIKRALTEHKELFEGCVVEAEKKEKPKKDKKKCQIL